MVCSFKSAETKMLWRVSQWSILIPVLFALYMLLHMIHRNHSYYDNRAIWKWPEQLFISWKKWYISQADTEKLVLWFIWDISGYHKGLNKNPAESLCIHVKLNILLPYLNHLIDMREWEFLQLSPHSQGIAGLL